jgi:hypothetical protein
MRPLTPLDAGKRIRITIGGRTYEGVLVWDHNDSQAPIGLRLIKGTTQVADAWFLAGTEGEPLDVQ